MSKEDITSIIENQIILSIAKEHDIDPSLIAEYRSISIQDAIRNYLPSGLKIPEYNPNVLLLTVLPGLRRHFEESSEGNLWYKCNIPLNSKMAKR